MVQTFIMLEKDWERNMELLGLGRDLAKYGMVLYVDSK